VHGRGQLCGRHSVTDGYLFIAQRLIDHIDTNVWTRTRPNTRLHSLPLKYRGSLALPGLHTVSYRVGDLVSTGAAGGMVPSFVSAAISSALGNNLRTVRMDRQTAWRAKHLSPLPPPTLALLQPANAYLRHDMGAGAVTPGMQFL